MPPHDRQSNFLLERHKSFREVAGQLNFLEGLICFALADLES